MGGRTEKNHAHLFGDQLRREIGTILRTLDDPRFADFWQELKEFGERNIRLVLQTPNGFQRGPFHATLTDRIEWLTANFVSPALKLEQAMNEPNRPHFTHWESDGDIVPEFWGTLAEHIKQARAEVESDIGGLKLDIDLDSQHTNDIRHQIVYETIEIFMRHFPDVKPSRGKWDKGFKTMTGEFPDYVRVVFKEITGSEEKLNGPIKRFIPVARK